MLKKEEITIDELAAMVQNGFNELKGELKGGIGELKDDIKKLQDGQTRIEMRLMNVVYRSEFEKLKEEVDMLKKAINMS